MYTRIHRCVHIALVLCVLQSLIKLYKLLEICVFVYIDEEQEAREQFKELVEREKVIELQIEQEKMHKVLEMTERTNLM